MKTLQKWQGENKLLPSSHYQTALITVMNVTIPDHLQ